MVIPNQYVYDPGIDKGIIHGTVFIGWDWVTTIAYDVNDRWSVNCHSHMDDTVLAKGALDSRDLYDGHPIQEGMDALPDDSLTGETYYL
jgi:hypothetical protein